MTEIIFKAFERAVQKRKKEKRKKREKESEGNIDKHCDSGSQNRPLGEKDPNCRKKKVKEKMRAFACVCVCVC